MNKNTANNPQIDPKLQTRQAITTILLLCATIIFLYPVNLLLYLAGLFLSIKWNLFKSWVGIVAVLSILFFILFMLFFVSAGSIMSNSLT
jgi:NhaP-type Na+/H+ and K+/H+ antiporter